MSKVPERPRVRNDLLAEIVNDEIVIVDSRLAQVHQLNPTASLVWDRLDGTHDVATLASLLTESFDIGAEVAFGDIEKLLVELAQLGLLE